MYCEHCGHRQRTDWYPLKVVGGTILALFVIIAGCAGIALMMSKLSS